MLKEAKTRRFYFILPHSCINVTDKMPSIFNLKKKQAFLNFPSSRVLILFFAVLKNERSFDKNSFSYIDDLTLPDNQKIINTALGYNSAKKLPKIKKKQAPPPTPTQNDTVLKPAIKTSSSKTSPKLSKRVKFQTNNNHFQSKHYGVIKNEQKLYRVRFNSLFTHFLHYLQLQIPRLTFKNCL